jgi:transcriptional regulator with XRE-family HTH domain
VNPNELARRIKQARLDVGLSQEQLAKKIRVQERTIRRWENGDSVPRSRHLGLLADATRTTVSALRGTHEGLTISAFMLGRPIEQDFERTAEALDTLAAREEVEPSLAAYLREARDRLFKEARKRHSQ